MSRSSRLLVLGALVLALLPPLEGAGAAQRRIRFEAPPAESLLVHGEYPKRSSSCVRPYQPLLHARFRGVVEVAKSADGSLFVIGELPFEDYLKGIAEVPRSWHLEALKAQVVAARTYAMTRLRRGSSEGRALGYDLCATDACQVYLGMGIEGGAWGERWVKAVESTNSEVLLHQGKTADTLYSSTSNGRTFPNEQIFGGTPQPYLRGIVENDDGQSPVSRWRVPVPLSDLRRFLAANGLWGGASITEVVQQRHRILIRGGGKRLRLSREALRDALNDVASCLDIDYPSKRPDGERLPQPVPSRWYEARQESSTVVLEGRGWGHGVGMVQWGAKGKADRGLDYREILGAYYGGLQPERVQTPGTIRVLIADDLESVTVVPSGDATVIGRASPPEFPWRVTGGKRLRLRTGARPTPVLELRADAPVTGENGLVIPIRLSKDASVRAEILADGSLVAATEWQPHEEGRSRYQPELEALDATGDAMRIVADDGVEVVFARAGAPPSPTPEETTATTEPTTSPSPRPADVPSAAPAADRNALWVGGIAVLALLAVAGLLLRRRKGSHRP